MAPWCDVGFSAGRRVEKGEKKRGEKSAGNASFSFQFFSSSRVCEHNAKRRRSGRCGRALLAPAGERNGQGEGERKRLEQRGSVVGESGDGNKAAEGEERSEVALGRAKFFCFRGFKRMRVTFFFSCAQRAFCWLSVVNCLSSQRALYGCRGWADVGYLSWGK